MKSRQYFIVLLIILAMGLSACSINQIQSSAEANPVDERSQKYKIDQNGNLWNYMDTLDQMIEKGDNYEIFSDEARTGYYYRVVDNYGSPIDYGYHDWRGSFGFNTICSILELEYGFGGPVWYRRYYDVSNGRVSRFFSKPVDTYGELVASYVDERNGDGFILVIQNMFDPSIYYQEIERDFSIFVYTMPSTAEFLDDGKRLRVTYWLAQDDEEVTEIIDLNPTKH